MAAAAAAHDCAPGLGAAEQPPSALTSHNLGVLARRRQSSPDGAGPLLSPERSPEPQPRGPLEAWLADWSECERRLLGLASAPPAEPHARDTGGAGAPRPPQRELAVAPRDEHVADAAAPGAKRYRRFAAPATQPARHGLRADKLQGCPRNPQAKGAQGTKSAPAAASRRGKGCREASFVACRTQREAKSRPRLSTCPHRITA